MKQAVILGGFFAAHGIWSVSEGEALIPMLATESADGDRRMSRFAGELLEEGVEKAQVQFDANPLDAARAAFVYDGFMDLPDGRTDALIVFMRDYALDATLTMAVPYRNAAHPDGFAVYRPKFVDWQGPGQPDYPAYGDAFFDGAETHEKAWAVWEAHADSSQ